MLQIAADTGGTFTDILVCEDGRIVAHKIRGSEDPSAALTCWLREFAGREYELLHGTTVATNAILENRMPGADFITDPGFEDILVIGRQDREELYSFEPRRERLIPTDATFETTAVCLINGFERQIEEEKSANGENVSYSSHIDPNIREFERASTTWLNARLLPVMSGYLKNICSIASGKVSIMLSSGGLAGIDSCLKSPISTVMSGPAAGIVATEWLAGRLGLEKVIAFDMGGTSTDVSIINCQATVDDSGCIRSSPVRTPRVAIHTVGCGGGSIAWIDSGGALRVGPDSAGARPGPAFFGGNDLTVSDANALLGRLRAEPFLARGEEFSIESSVKAAEPFCARLAVSAKEVAEAVIDIADNAMASAIRKVSSQAGYAPREFALIAYGGGAGLHACAVADALDIRKVVVPQMPGLFSSFGLLLAPQIAESRRSVVDNWRSEIESEILRLEGKFNDETKIIKLALSMRYVGQSHNLLIPIQLSDSESTIQAAFVSEHKSRFGFVHKQRDVCVVGISVRIEVPAKIRDYKFEIGRCSVPKWFISREEIRDVPIRGPLGVSLFDTTLWIPENWSIVQGYEGTLILSRQ